MKKELKIVIDIDDTICTNFDKLSYDKCIPKKNMIEKINFLHDEMNAHIVLYTSRGMVSCNGDVQKSKEKNEKVLIEWLQKNGVKYDEIIFGKPIADLYVDDKAVSAKEFEEMPIGRLDGGSGHSVMRMGKVVKKQLGEEEKVKNFKLWYKRKPESLFAPEIYSYLYSEVYMEYVRGVNLHNYMDPILLDIIIKTIEGFRFLPLSEFNVNKHIEVLEKNRQDNFFINKCIDAVEIFLKKNENLLREYASFSHGDTILSNLILNDKGVYFIDPNYDEEASSWVLDLAKLKMSLSGYEYKFGMSKTLLSRFNWIFDEHLKRKGIRELVVNLTLMYICRLYRYKSEEEKTKVEEFAKEFVIENEECFEWNQEG